MEASSVRVRPQVSTLKKCMGWYPGAYNFPIHPPSAPQESQFVTNGGGPDFLFPLTSSSFTALLVTPDPLKDVTLENTALMPGVFLALFIMIVFVVSYRRSPWRKLPSGPRRLPIIGNTLQLLDKTWLRSEDCKERFSGSSPVLFRKMLKCKLLIMLKRK